MRDFRYPLFGFTTLPFQRVIFIFLPENGLFLIVKNNEIILAVTRFKVYLCEFNMSLFRWRVTQKLKFSPLSRFDIKRFENVFEMSKILVEIYISNLNKI